MRWRHITALVVLFTVLFIFISPVLSSPKTALRAQQIAAVFFYLIGALGTVLLSVIPAPTSTQMVEVWDPPLAESDLLSKSCLLRL